MDASGKLVLLEKSISSCILTNMIKFLLSSYTQSQRAYSISDTLW